VNEYGARLMRQWKQADPERFQRIPDPETFFTEKGLELEREVQTLASALAGPDRPGETYEQKLARLQTARFNAESDLIREAMIPDPGDVDTPLDPEAWGPAYTGDLEDPEE
jgi:hypothetical protein